MQSVDDGFRGRRVDVYWSIIALASAGLAGALLSIGSIYAAAFLIALMVSVPFLGRVNWVLYALFITTYVIAGVAQSFFNVNQLQWLSSFFSLYLIFLFFLFSFKKGYEVKIGLVGAMLLLFCIVLVFSSVINSIPALQWFVGGRTYLPYWGVSLVLFLGLIDWDKLKGLFYILLFVGCVQWIFCLYQKIIVVPKRLNLHVAGSAWDSIVGTFGGSVTGGGESGSLGVFLVVVFALVICLAAEKILSRWISISFFILFLIAMALTEAKVIFVLLPLSLFFAFPESVRNKPIKYLLLSICVFLVLFALAYSYYFFFWSGNGGLGFVDSLVNRMAYSFDPDFYASSEYPGRIAALVSWYSLNSIADNPASFLIGHGIASAVGVSSILGVGSATKIYGLGLDATGASKLLWEAGILGLGLFLSVFFVNYFRAMRLKDDVRIPEWHRAALRAAGAAMPVIVIGVFYEVTSVSSPPMQLTACFMVGYVSYWHRFVKNESEMRNV